MSNQIGVQVKQIGPSSSEGTAREHTAIIDRPEAKGGENRGAMGGEYILIGLGGCFMSNLLAAIKSREADIAQVNVDVVGTLESSPSRFSAIEMNVSAEYSDRDQMEKLITIAERGCIAANTLRAAVALSVKLV